MRNFTFISAKQLFFQDNKFINRNLAIQLIAGFSLINICILLPDLFKIFGETGLIQFEVTKQFIFSYQPVIHWFTKPFGNSLLARNIILIIFTFMYIFSLLNMIRNYKRLFYSILAWLLHFILMNSSFLMTYGADGMISFALFITVFLSVPIIFPKTKSIMGSFVIRFLQVHLCLVYFFGGLGKFLGTDWLDGNALWYVSHMFSPEYSEFFSFFAKYPFVFKVMGWIVLFSELFYPLLIYTPVLKKWCLSIIILMHFFIAVTMHLYTFGAVMILLNLIAFGQYFQKEYWVIKDCINYAEKWLKIKIFNRYIA